MSRLHLILILGLLLVFAASTLAQDSTPTPEGYIEGPQIVRVVDATAAPDGNESALQSFFDFVIEGNLLQWLGLYLAIYFLGVSFPQSKIDKLLAQAEKTATPIDDWLYQALDKINRDKTGGADDPEPEPEEPVEPEPPEPEPEEPVEPEPPQLTAPVNANPTLMASGFQSKRYDGRNVDIPNGYQYYYQLGSEKTHVDMFQQPGKGYIMNLAFRSGRFGFEQRVFLRDDYTYDITVKALANLNGDKWRETVTVEVELFSETGEKIELEGYQFENGGNVFNWNSGKVPARGYYVFRVYASVIWGILGDSSAVTWQEIRVAPYIDS